MTEPTISLEQASNECWDAVVVGAGPAGTLAARQLADLGGRVLLVDRRACPRRKVCGACLSHRAIAILATAGMRESLEGLAGRRLDRFCLSSKCRKLNLKIPSGRAVSRAKFDAMLVHAAIEAGAEFLPETTATVATCSSQARSVVLQSSAVRSGSAVHVQAKVVIVADGLGHPSLSALHEFTQVRSSTSRIGAGCELPIDETEFSDGAIHMGIGRHGYIGLVIVEAGVLNVAAAIDPEFVRNSGGLGTAAAAILSEANLCPPAGLNDAIWQGTSPLTRSPVKRAAERLFLIGDAAGYIEPFTGEGISWALMTGIRVAPLAQAGWRHWNPTLAAEWNTIYQRTVARQQALCRILVRLTRSPWCVAAGMTGAALFPWLPSQVANWIHGEPAFGPTPLSAEGSAAVDHATT